MGKKPVKHSIETISAALKAKGLDAFIDAIEIVGNTVKLRDRQFGEYQVDIKAVSPKTPTPLHKNRRFQARLNKIREKFVGTSVNGLKVTDVFYGPERGYKNRSFYIEYIGECGHSGINTYAIITKHRKSFACRSCSRIEHGERLRIDGKLKQRTSTYNHWIKVKSTLPEKYQDFKVFQSTAGEKPYKRAELVIDGDALSWANLQVIDSGADLSLIASAIRQAFRHSPIYKNAIEAARVETEDGPRYRCAACGELAKRKQIQVDHITPIQDLSGEPLKKETLIDRIWTTEIQILDKKCHSSKSSAENKIRRENKKRLTK